MRFEVSGLDVFVGERQLLAGVAFALEPGQALHLTGRSGLGKTTLLRTLAALHADPGPSVRLGSDTVRALGEPTWRTRCMLMAQAPAMFPGSVRENLERPFAFGAARIAFDQTRAQELLQALNVFRDAASEWDREATQLSGGERQRVHLVRVLLLNPDVILADEPVASLDGESAASVWDALRNYREQGGRVVLLHHGERPEDYDELDLGSFACPT